MTISYDTPFADYLVMPGEHFSTLKSMAVSPRHYLRAREHARADTPALDLGRLVHALVLTPSLVNVAVFDGARRGKRWDDFRCEAIANGATIVRPNDHATAHRIAHAVSMNADARALLRDGAPEVTVTWGEQIALPQIDGDPWSIRCRARLDFLGVAGVVELKTTRRTPTPRAWGREVAAYAYHAQLAHYIAGLEANGVDVAHAHWIVVESAPPHDVVVYRLQREDLEAGERLRLQWLRRVAECEASGQWPGVGGEGVIDFQLPEWAATEGLPDVDMDQLEGGDGDGDAAAE